MRSERMNVILADKERYSRWKEFAMQRHKGLGYLAGAEKF